jgi:hypothetical protein
LIKDEIKKAEQDIDEAFAKSELIDLGYSQAVWTLLSVVEDHHFLAISPLDQEKREIYIDGLLNALTYPLQICLKKFPLYPIKITKQLIDDDYKEANKWIDKAEHYTNFCSIFPLYHHGEIELSISGNHLITTDWSKYDLSYEAYDRFVIKRQLEDEKPSDLSKVAESIKKQTCIRNNSFKLHFNPKLIKELKEHLHETYSLRFSLPNDWKFRYFSILEFKEVFTTIQSMSFGWFIARQFAVYEGVSAVGFKDSLWTPTKTELITRLKRYTSVELEKINIIIDYLTFGQAGIRTPDIAIQPIVDLKNGELAISSFVFMHVNCERNLCVLLNQIKEERNIYSGLVKDKENKLRDEIINRLNGTGYEFQYGELDETDIDLAIIDRKQRKCITIELKWFIEPAEIREVIQRSEEIKKGVQQAKKINNLWQNNDKRLVFDILKIDKDFDFLAIVASVTSIGNLSAQDVSVPVIKAWHLIEEIINIHDLSVIMNWLINKGYLLKRNIDFEVQEVPINSGKWSAIWYGIIPNQSNNQ